MNTTKTANIQKSWGPVQDAYLALSAATERVKWALIDWRSDVLEKNPELESRAWARLQEAQQNEATAIQNIRDLIGYSGT